MGALRQALEPGRAPRTPPRLLVTEGPGYALRTDAVDAWRFEAALDDPDRLEAALSWWRGPAYADFADCPVGARGAGAADGAAAAGGRAPGRDAPGARPGRRRRSRTSTPTSPSTRGARTPGACSRSPSTARVARPTRSRSCAARGGCWSRNSASIRAPRCNGWRRTSSTTPTTSGGRRGVGAGGGRLRPDGRRRRAGAAGVDRRAAARPRGHRRPRGGARAPRGGGRRGRGAGRPGADRARDRRLRRPGDLDPRRRPRAGGGHRRRGRAHADRARPGRARRGAGAATGHDRARVTRHARPPRPRGRRARRRRSPAASTIRRCSPSPSTPSSCSASSGPGWRPSATRSARS